MSRHGGSHWRLPPPSDDVIQLIDDAFNRKFTYRQDPSHPWTLPPIMIDSTPITVTPDEGRASDGGTEGDCELMQLKRELNVVKSSLNEVDITTWNRHTGSLHRGGAVRAHIERRCNAELCTQAWCKFHEILAAYPALVAPLLPGAEPAGDGQVGKEAVKAGPICEQAKTKLVGADTGCEWEATSVGNIQNGGAESEAEGAGPGAEEAGSDISMLGAEFEADLVDLREGYVGGGVAQVGQGDGGVGHGDAGVGRGNVKMGEGSVFNTLHLCEAPGAFVASLNHFLAVRGCAVSRWRWLASTLNPYHESNALSAMIDNDELIRSTLARWTFLKDDTGDLTHPSNLAALRGVCEGRGLVPVHLVTADGSVDCADDPAEQEARVARLQLCEVVGALSVLGEGGGAGGGGNLVLKVFTMFEHTSVCLIYLLCCLFKQVSVMKPVTSKPGNSELYVVCLSLHTELIDSFLLTQLTQLAG